MRPASASFRVPEPVLPESGSRQVRAWGRRVSAWRPGLVLTQTGAGRSIAPVDARTALSVTEEAMRLLVLLIATLLLAGCTTAASDGRYATPSRGGWDNFRG